MALNGGLSVPFLRKVQVGHTSLNIQSAALYAISETITIRLRQHQNTKHLTYIIIRRQQYNGLDIGTFLRKACKGWLSQGRKHIVINNKVPTFSMAGMNELSWACMPSALDNSP